MLLLATLAVAHVPFFADKVAVLERHSDISQVYYFKRSGSLYGSVDTTVSIIGPKQRKGGCHAVIDCDGNVTVVPFEGGGYKVEPFTQSRYYTYYEEARACKEMYVKGYCGSPWGAVVGVEEEFHVVDLLAMPGVVARVHGSWWNHHYIVGWLLLVFLPLPFLAELELGHTFLVAAIVVSLAFMIDKIVATALFASSFLAWTLTFAELIIIAAAAFLIVSPSRVAAKASILLAILFLFLFGIGFFLGNVFLLIGSVAVLLV